MRNKILIVGDGQVGYELSQQATKLVDLEVRSVNRRVLDLERLETIRSVIQEYRPDVVINAAAYTNVEKAEDEPDRAELINGTAIGYLMEETKSIGGLLVHYSTDYVFDGTSSQPYKESDTTNPQSAYGRSKVLGERYIKQVGGDALIFRTSWVYGLHGDNFYKKMLALGQQRDELSIVEDQTGAPTPASWLASIALQVAKIRLDPSSSSRLPLGIFHTTAAGQTNWYEYAKFVFSLANQYSANIKTPLVKSTKTTNMNFKAKRPEFSVLDNVRFNSEICQQFDLVDHQPDWQNSVRVIVSQHLNLEFPTKKD